MIFSHLLVVVIYRVDQQWERGAGFTSDSCFQKWYKNLTWYIFISCV